MSVGSAIVGSAIISGVMGQNAADSAADASRDAANMSREESARQFNITRGDTAPYRNIGEVGLYRLSDVLGLGLTDEQKKVLTDRGLTVGGSPSDIITATPGYAFRLSEAEKGLQRMQNAGGYRYSGRALKELARFNQDYASGEYGNYLESLYRLSGLGVNAVNTSAASGSAHAGRVGAINTNMGNAIGNATIAGASSINNAIQGGLGNYLTLRTYNDWMGRMAPSRGGMSLPNVPSYTLSSSWVR